MQLKNFIIILGVIEMLISGLCIFIGSRKAERKFTKYHLLAVIFGAISSLSIIIFLNLPVSSEMDVKCLASGIFLAPVLMDIFLLSYILYSYKVFRYISVGLAIVFFGFISFILLFDTADFYNGFTLSTEGNSFNITPTPVYLSYAIFFILSTALMALGIILRAKKVKSLQTKHGLTILSITGILLRFLFLIFAVIAPITHFELIFLAPITLTLMIILDYYAVLRYQIIKLSSGALKLLSYVIIAANAGVIYMLIFYAIITFLFKIRDLSTEIYILTFIMVTILLLILPIMSELLQFVRSLILKDQIYLGSILKKLNKMSGRTDADELAEFLASNLHFDYIGIVVGNKVHGAKSEKFSKAEIKVINDLKEPERGVWQQIDSGTKLVLDEHKIKAVAAMFNAKGKVFGQILVGAPRGKENFEQRDLAQLEVIVNIISAMIDSRS